ncbi:Arc family DNA-binding protein [Pseudooceanicola atlanticus]|uniref:Arc family DNA-binding protein n=1 Tax=Pseudooceanicola atlanticus TaxID=1461694 RepID=UPI00235681C0|nr:Arc family DNA-binding protein [Pseudooceanicola atlanticus]
MDAIQSRIGNQDVVQTALRLPLPLREKLKEEARSLGRSLNTHIVMRLSEGVEKSTAQK